MNRDATPWPMAGTTAPQAFERPRTTGSGERLAWALAVPLLVLGGWFGALGHTVQATVTAVPEEAVCAVGWTYGGVVYDGTVDCRSETQVGDVLTVQALGAPFVGEVLDLWITPWALGVLVAGSLGTASLLTLRRRRGVAAGTSGLVGAGHVIGAPAGPPVDPGLFPAYGATTAPGLSTGYAAVPVPRTTHDARPVFDERYAGTAPVLPDAPDVPVGTPCRGEDVYVAVRSRDGHPGLAEVVEALRATGFVGAAHDGAAVDAPGWVLATTVGFGDGTVVRWASAEDELRTDLTWDTVRSALTQRFGPDVQVGRHVVLESGRYPSFAGLDGVPPLDTARQQPGTQVAVGTWAVNEMAMIAHLVGGPVHAAPVDGVVVVQHAEVGVPPRLLAAAAYRTKAPRLLLWSAGSQTGFQVWARDEVAVTHSWGVRWTLVDPTTPRADPDEWCEVDDVLDQFRRVDADGGRLAALYGVQEPGRVAEVARLLADPAPRSAVPRLLTALGLPGVAGDALTGRRRVADLPGARLEMPVSFAAGVLRGMGGGSWQTAGTGADRRRWYEWPDSVNPWWRAAAVAGVTVLHGSLRFQEGDVTRAWATVGGGVAVLLADLLIERARRRRRARVTQVAG